MLKIRGDITQVRSLWFRKQLKGKAAKGKALRIITLLLFKIGEQEHNVQSYWCHGLTERRGGTFLKLYNEVVELIATGFSEDFYQRVQ